MLHGRFGTMIACTDGRIQQPVAHWLKRRYFLDYIDAITTPGADRVLAQGSAEMVGYLETSAKISATRHESFVLAIVGHHDCAGNPASREEHIKQIKQAMVVVRSWELNLPLVGLLVGESGQVEVIEE
jgi:hypothetical protein